MAILKDANGNTMQVSDEELARLVVKSRIPRLTYGPAEVPVDPKGPQPMGRNYPERNAIPQIGQPLPAHVDTRALADSQGLPKCAADSFNDGQCDAEQLTMQDCAAAGGNVPVAVGSKGTVMKTPDYRQGGRSGLSLKRNAELLPLATPITGTQTGAAVLGPTANVYALAITDATLGASKMLAGVRIFLSRQILTTQQAIVRIYGDPSVVINGASPLPPAGLFRDTDAIRGFQAAPLDLQIDGYAESVDLPLFYRSAQGMDTANNELGKLVPSPGGGNYGYLNALFGIAPGTLAAAWIIVSDSPLNGVRIAPWALNNVDAPDAIGRSFLISQGGGY